MESSTVINIPKKPRARTALYTSRKILPNPRRLPKPYIYRGEHSELAPVCSPSQLTLNAFSQYIDNKGFCEDLDEGKYSVLLIHSLQKGDHVIPAILQQRKITGSLTKEMKLLVLERLRVNGSFDYTLRIMEDLFALIQVGLEALERETKTKNWILRRVLYQLRV